VDLYPTLLEVAGAEPPANYPLDGVSYFKLLTGGGQGSLSREAIFWHFPGYLGAGVGAWRTTPAGAIRSGDWKLQEYFEDGRLELYNLREDLSQKNNLAAAQPDKVKELQARLTRGARPSTPHAHKNTEQGQPPKARRVKRKRRRVPLRTSHKGQGAQARAGTPNRLLKNPRHAAWGTRPTGFPRNSICLVGRCPHRARFSTAC